MLVDHFCRRAAHDLKLPIAQVNPEALAMLIGYAWPGNVRELQNVIERATLLCAGGPISPTHLPRELTGELPVPRVECRVPSAECRVPTFDMAAIGDGGPASGDSHPGQPNQPGQPGSRAASLWDYERALIQQALEHAGWNQSQAARNLGISRDNLRYRMKKYKIRGPGAGGQG